MIRASDAALSDTSHSPPSAAKPSAGGWESGAKGREGRRRWRGAVPIALALALLAPAALAAQEGEGEAAGDTVPEAAFELEPLVVEVTRSERELARVPQSVSVRGQEEIQVAQRQMTPVESLQGVPGVWALNRRNFSLSGGVRLSIRAPLPRFGMRGLQVLQDGIPLTVADGTTQPGNLSMGTAGSIEVVRGPSSVLYGNSAGGVISVRTEFPADRSLVARPRFQFGSYGYERQQIKAEGTVRDLGYVVNASRVEMDGFRKHSHQLARKANLVSRVDLGSSTELRGAFNFFDTPFSENHSTLTKEDARKNPRSVRSLAIEQGWGESATQGQGGLTLTHELDGGGTVQLTGWAMWRDVWNPIPFSVIDLGRVGAGLRSEYRDGVRIGDLPVEWTAGFDVSHQDDDRKEFENAGVPEGGDRTREGDLLLSQTEAVRSVAPFAQLAVDLTPAWTFTLGARYDYYDFEAEDRFLTDGDQSGGRTLDEVSPTVGLTYSPSQAVNVYTNYATAYQTPTTVELSNRPSGQGGFNPELGPSDLRSFELGIRGLLSDLRLRYEVTGYMSTLEDALVRFEGPSEQAFFRNAGESSRDGLEVLLEWMPVSTLKTRLAYTYQDFEYVTFTPAGNDFSGNTEPGTPPHRVFAGLTYESPRGIRSSLDFHWVDAYPVNDANTVSNWAYRVVDFRLGLTRTWNGVEVRPFLGVDNVFDERYNGSIIPNAFGDRYFEPAPDREFYVGLQVGAGIR